jgi:hypothetical protein
VVGVGCLAAGSFVAGVNEVVWLAWVGG